MILLAYALIVIVLLFAVGWRKFVSYVHSEINRTKYLFSLFSIDALLDNNYIASYLKKSSKNLWYKGKPALFVHKNIFVNMLSLIWEWIINLSKKIKDNFYVIIIFAYLISSLLLFQELQSFKEKEIIWYWK